MVAGVLILSTNGVTALVLERFKYLLTHLLVDKATFRPKLDVAKRIQGRGIRLHRRQLDHRLNDLILFNLFAHRAGEVGTCEGGCGRKACRNNCCYCGPIG